jgi:hypothetical protein
MNVVVTKNTVHGVNPPVVKGEILQNWFSLLWDTIYIGFIVLCAC